MCALYEEACPCPDRAGSSSLRPPPASSAPPPRERAIAEAATPDPTPTPVAGTPPAFGTAPPTGPEVSAATFAEAEKLVRYEMTAAERTQAAGSWARAMAGTMERRTGPRKVRIEDSVAPASLFDPMIPGVVQDVRPQSDRFVRSTGAAPPLPKNDEDIAYATLAQQSRWIESKALTSTRLTGIYLDRIARLDPKLRSVITVTRELALEQAKRADSEIARGDYRGPLHGIPWGTKDLLDTKGIKTTWGAEPYRDRVPTTDAVVVERLHKAGAVLVAKLSLGALALNDIWFGGQTMNPWVHRGRLRRQQRGARRGDRGGSGRILDRQRDRGIDRGPVPCAAA